jgi:hypothetical protein
LFKKYDKRNTGREPVLPSATFALLYQFHVVLKELAHVSIKPWMKFSEAFWDLNRAMTAKPIRKCSLLAMLSHLTNSKGDKTAGYGLGGYRARNLGAPQISIEKSRVRRKLVQYDGTRKPLSIVGAAGRLRPSIQQGGLGRSLDPVSRSPKRVSTRILRSNLGLSLYALAGIPSVDYGSRKVRTGHDSSLAPGARTKESEDVAGLLGWVTIAGNVELDLPSSWIAPQGKEGQRSANLMSGTRQTGLAPRKLVQVCERDLA